MSFPGRSGVASGSWLALFAAGQVASLRLIDAGPLVRYQHYGTPGRMVTEHPLALAITIAWIVLSALGAAAGLRDAMAWLRERMTPARALIALLCCATIAAALSQSPGVFVTELLFASLVQAAALASTALAVAALPAPVLAKFAGAVDRILGAAGDEVVPGSPDRLAWTLAALVTVAAAILNVVAYQGHPHIPDEVAYLIQSRYFADGLLAMPAPPVPDAFNLDLFEYEPTRWYSIFPPGWPAVLAIGARVGAAWLVNPVVAGMNILLAATLLREILPPRTARIATILLALSPWHLFLGMSFMAHTLSLTMTLIAALAVARMRRTGLAGAGWIGGAAIGVVSVMRPLEGVAVAAVLGLVSLTAKGRSFRFAPALTLTLGAMVAGLLSLVYNRALTGSPLVFPVMAYFDKHYAAGVNAMGFGANRGLGWRGLDPLPGHGPLDVMINGALNSFAINIELLGWASGSLIAIALLVASGRIRRIDRVLIGAALTVVVAHSFYWFSGGPDFGARYWFLTIVPLIALAARGLDELARGASPAHDPRPVLVAAALSAAALLFFVPWRAVDKYRDYRGMKPGVERLAQTRNFGSSLVLIRGKRHPDYASAAPYNPIDLGSAAPIYAWDRSRAVRGQLLRAYAGRPIWFVDGPSVGTGDFVVVAGPLSADSAVHVPGFWETNADPTAHDASRQP